MSFRKPQYCMAYMVLAISLVGGIYIICRDYLAFVFLWERITVLPFRYLFMMIFLLLCAFICMGVAFSAISHRIIKSADMYYGVVWLFQSFCSVRVCYWYRRGSGLCLHWLGRCSLSSTFPVIWLV